MEYPCPKCDQQFAGADPLLFHVLMFHNVQTLSGVIKAMRQLTKDSFTQIDSHWIYAVGPFHLSITPNDKGEFSLHVYGSVEPIPPSTLYPTEPEWDRALLLANKFMSAYATALETDKNN